MMTGNCPIANSLKSSSLKRTGVLKFLLETNSSIQKCTWQRIGLTDMSVKKKILLIEILTTLYLVIKLWRASTEFGNPRFISAPSYYIVKSKQLIY
jgi:hypothetical protein